MLGLLKRWYTRKTIGIASSGKKERTGTAGKQRAWVLPMDILTAFSS
jgi:hypothetical protein